MGKKVYGVKVADNVEDSATKFMHAQSTITGLSFCTGLCSLMFSLIILHQLKNAYTSAADGEFKGDNVSKLELLMKKSWIESLIGLVLICCIGSALFALAREIVSSKSTLGLRFCCVFEGMCSCCGAVEGLAYCLVFGYMIGIAANMGDPVAFCEGLSKYNLTQATSAPVNITAPQGLRCENWISHLKPAFNTAAVWIFILGLCSCKIAAACFAGAKYANETEDKFYDEESKGLQE